MKSIRNGLSASLMVGALSLSAAPVDAETYIVAVGAASNSLQGRSAAKFAEELQAVLGGNGVHGVGGLGQGVQSGVRGGALKVDAFIVNPGGPDLDRLDARANPRFKEVAPVVDGRGQEAEAAQVVSHLRQDAGKGRVEHGVRQAVAGACSFARVHRDLAVVHRKPAVFVPRRHQFHQGGRGPRLSHEIQSVLARCPVIGGAEVDEKQRRRRIPAGRVGDALVG